ncbi:hypothetical protein J7J00_25345 [Bacillus sp. ISL-4]|uniref:hypothetical protein n=1 Tax=Bacillus sp. ISL-4 TaxID=2819125 RepID=UPI001BE89DF5|nr:hypothetical protein [Bacillus sp. ISL-4]MBT2668759.1 hypothetical protein [Bacillus sp. ISL-4]MBT2672984.1 hypothetical protein [Streptomyces sp. ISL-14]
MANSKKRLKRQLMKRVKQTSGTVFKPWLDPVIVESNEPPKEYRAHILYKGKYEERIKHISNNLTLGTKELLRLSKGS